MMRLVLIGVAAFILPFAAWTAWHYWRRRRSGVAAASVPMPRDPAMPPAPLIDWTAAPWQSLIVIGLAMALLAWALLLAVDGDVSANCDWVASSIVDGKLVPAHCR